MRNFSFKKLNKLFGKSKKEDDEYLRDIRVIKSQYTLDPGRQLSEEDAKKMAAEYQEKIDMIAKDKEMLRKLQEELGVPTSSIDSTDSIDSDEVHSSIPPKKQEPGLYTIYFLEDGEWLFFDEFEAPGRVAALRIAYGEVDEDVKLKAVLNREVKK